MRTTRARRLPPSMRFTTLRKSGWPRRKLVVIDATNVQSEARKPLIETGLPPRCACIAIVLDVPERVCRTRNETRADRQFGPHVLSNQSRQLRESLRAGRVGRATQLKREGFRYVFLLDETQIANAQIVRVPLWTIAARRAGRTHRRRCAWLLRRVGGASWQTRLCAGYGEFCMEFTGGDVAPSLSVTWWIAARRSWRPCGWYRHALCRDGALRPGNHDIKLLRALKGNAVTVSHGLAESLAEIEALPEAERDAFKKNTYRLCRCPGLARLAGRRRALACPRRG